MEKNVASDYLYTTENGCRISKKDVYVSEFDINAIMNAVLGPVEAANHYCSVCKQKLTKTNSSVIFTLKLSTLAMNMNVNLGKCIHCKPIQSGQPPAIENMQIN